MDENNVYSPPAADLTVTSTDNLASRWTRLGAAILDTIFIMMFAIPIMIYGGYWDRAVAGEATLMDTLLLFTFGIVVYLAMNGYLLSRHGQTVGKKIMRIKIVKLDRDEILPLWKVFCLRYLPVDIVAQIPLLGPWLAIIDALFIFRRDKRCLHDFIAGTRVIRLDP